jgi:hypothetical protein
MSTQVQYRRGTGAQNDAFTGALAEITVDTTALTLRVHDGLTAGGSNIATVTYVNNAIGSLSANSITDGTSSVAIVATNGNVRTNVAGSTVSTVYSDGVLVTGLVSATGNITGGNLSGTAITGTLSTAAQTNITSVGTLTSLSVSGNVQGGNLLTDGLISAAGTVTGTTFVGIATQAQYADLAEYYIADVEYPVGTVLEFGGNNEVTQSTSNHATSIAGTVSDKPAYIMNSGLDHPLRTPVALMGRVPCRVVGTIRKGDRLVASDMPGVATVLDPTLYQPGCIIGKALEDYNSSQPGIIEVVVGRL